MTQLDDKTVRLLEMAIEYAICYGTLKKAHKQAARDDINGLLQEWGRKNVAPIFNKLVGGHWPNEPLMDILPDLGTYNMGQLPRLIKDYDLTGCMVRVRFNAGEGEIEGPVERVTMDNDGVLYGNTHLLIRTERAGIRVWLHRVEWLKLLDLGGR